MRNTEYFSNKKVTVVGLARSGMACAQLLAKVGAEVSVTELQDIPVTQAAARCLASTSIAVEIGRHSRGFIQGRDLIVISPGVPSSSPAVKIAQDCGITIVSEIEIAWKLCPGMVIAVTGSSGKTTVTTLIGKIIDASGRKVVVCGNIGNPFSGEVEKIQPDDYVSLEISSFQLERIQDFKPKIAVMLNFNCNHLDRHKDIQEYLDAKKRIFMNQDEGDFLILNEDDPVLINLSTEAKSTVRYFSQDKEFDPNQAAVVTVGSILGINKETCIKVFSEFKGLEHRLEFVGEINRIRFVNDSKATLVESTIWAIQNITSPIILIAGGRHKGVDYTGILAFARNKVKEVILIGEAKERIAKALRGELSLDEAATLEEAVAKAFRKAVPGDCVLLSPMCSSFDMFSDYQERGRAFKEAVYNLTKR